MTELATFQPAPGSDPPGIETERRRGRRPSALRGARHRLPQARGLLPLVAFLVIWQLVGDQHSPYFPPPNTWWDAVKSLADQGVLWPAIGATAELFALALVISTAVGAALGLLMGSLPVVDRAVGPTTEFLRTLPAAAIVPIFVLVLGNNGTTDLVVVVLGTLWPVLLSTRDAMRTMNPLYKDVARTLHLSSADRLRRVTAPALIPAVLLGVQVMAPTTLIIVILVELITNISGLGSQMAKAQQSFLSAEVYGLVGVACLIALVLNLMLIGLEGYTARFRR